MEAWRGAGCRSSRTPPPPLPVVPAGEQSWSPAVTTAPPRGTKQMSHLVELVRAKARCRFHLKTLNASLRVRLCLYECSLLRGLRRCAGFALAVERGAALQLQGMGSLCGGLSCWGAQTGSRAPGLRSCGLQALERAFSTCCAHRLRCLVACGIVLDLGLNSCLLHFKVDS